MAETSRIVNAHLVAILSEYRPNREKLFKTPLQQVGTRAEMFKVWHFEPPGHDLDEEGKRGPQITQITQIFWIVLSG